MDDAYSAAVMRFFTHSDRATFIRGSPHRELVPGSRQEGAAIFEVKHREVDDTLTWIRYPLVEGDGHVTHPDPCARRRCSPMWQWPFTRADECYR